MAHVKKLQHDCFSSIPTTSDLSLRGFVFSLPRPSLFGESGATVAHARRMKLVAGSYERFLWGWRVDEKNDQLSPIFSYPAHLGPIKCVAALGPVLATGGSDDVIKIFDLDAKRDMGTLIMHQGAITCLSFYTAHAVDYPNNLLSGSEDGTVCIWDTNSWEHFKTMKGHKRGVNDIAIHPSGRLALSVGRDFHLNMYNLLKGRCTFTNNLQYEGSLIRFAPETGDRYSVVNQEVVTVHNSEDGRCLHSFEHSKRVLCMAQHEDNILFTGGEDCTICTWDNRSGELSFAISPAHASRIRGITVLGSGRSFCCDDVPFLVASASSDGFVRIWDTRILRKSENKKQPTPIMEAETGARLTSLVGSSLKRTKKMASKASEVLPMEETHCKISTQLETGLCEKESSPALPSKLKDSADSLVVQSDTGTHYEREKIRKTKKKKKRDTSFKAQDGQMSIKKWKYR